MMHDLKDIRVDTIFNPFEKCADHCMRKTFDPRDSKSYDEIKFCLISIYS